MWATVVVHVQFIMYTTQGHCVGGELTIYGYSKFNNWKLYSFMLLERTDMANLQIFDISMCLVLVKFSCALK